MVDHQGYRENIGIVLINDKQQILLAKRYRQNDWQLPQGGIDKNEAPLTALFRELYEEIGLSSEHVKVLAKTPKWLYYNLPKKYIRSQEKPLCIGQKQVWFLLKLTASIAHIKLDQHTEIEFDHWRWVNYWYPIEAVIAFKKHVYEDMLKALAPVVFNNQHRVPPQYRRPLKCCAVVLSK